MKYITALLGILLFMVSCQEPQARRPVEVKGGSFLKQSVQRNRALLQREDSVMVALIRLDSLHEYVESSSGFRYYYDQHLPDTGYLPSTDDRVTLTYDLRTWNEDTIYRREEIGIIRYKVDKQELFPGLAASVKLLREGETATFMYPSSLGYGYQGDKDLIGPNLPLKSTLSILKIEKESNNEN